MVDAVVQAITEVSLALLAGTGEPSMWIHTPAAPPRGIIRSTRGRHHEEEEEAILLFATTATLARRGNFLVLLEPTENRATGAVSAQAAPVAIGTQVQISNDEEDLAAIAASGSEEGR